MPEAPESLAQRVRRIAPYFASSRRGLALAALSAIVGAIAEPMIPSFVQHLLDAGCQQRSLPLWQISLIVIGLFGLRGFAGFVAQYGLAPAANRAMVDLRSAQFERMMNAQPALFGRQAASTLINTVTFEIQAGANRLTHSLTSLVRDSLTLVALLGYLLWLNWKLTLFVGVLFPAVAWIMRTLSRRLHRLTVEGQKAIDELAYVVGEDVLAWRIVRLHGAQSAERSRFARVSNSVRRLAVKAAVARPPR